MILVLSVVLHPLPNNVEMQLMRSQPQHDQIGISPIDTVPLVRVVPRGRPLPPYEVQNLVLALPRDAGIAEDDLETLPLGVVLKSLHNVELEVVRHSGHELCAGSDDVLVKFDPSLLFFGKSIAFLHVLRLELVFSNGLFFDFLGSSEPSSTLLIHFCSWGNSVDSEVNELLGLHNSYQFIDILEYIVKHLCFTCRLLSLLAACAGMDDAIHVQVKAVHVWIRNCGIDASKVDVVGV